MILAVLNRINGPRVVKYGFLISLLACLGVFFSFVFLSQGNVTEVNYEDDFKYSPKSTSVFSQDVLDENFQKCIFSTLTSNLLLRGANSTGGNLFPDVSNKTIKETFTVKKSSLFPILKIFTDLMSYFKIETVLIEPSALFCMLEPRYKNLLLKRNFHLKGFSRSMHILTFGIRGIDVAEFEKPGSKVKLLADGFRMQIVKESLLSWMKPGNDGIFDDHFISHVFLKNKDWVIHLVPFYERRDFLWHASLDVNKNDLFRELYFAEWDSAYENFTYQSLGFKAGHLTNLNIPSNPQFFLFETMSSKFLECNSTIVSNFFKYNQTGVPKNHYSLSVESFNERTEVGLKELKAIFNPLLMNFWIWSGTMLGWYRQCDVIPYTSDADFAAWASEVDNLDDILQRINKSDHLELRQRMGIVEQSLEFNLNCHKLRVDVFFLYPESNGTWYAGHRPSRGYYFKYHHPNFSLCSAELLSHKVLVPCETEKVIVTEYGSDWMKPVSSWNYESSIKNRGPNIYWDKSMLTKVYLDA